VWITKFGFLFLFFLFPISIDSNLAEGSGTLLLAVTELLNRNRIMYEQTHQQHDANPAEIDIDEESLAIADNYGFLPLHILLINKSSSIALVMIERYPAALQHRNDFGYLPLHMECQNQCRSSIISKCIELYPETLAIPDSQGFLPLHLLILSKSSSVADALMMIEKYPAALQHRTNVGNLPLHMECQNQCRSSIILQCIELYPEALAIPDSQGFLPLHLLILSKSSSVADALMVIEKYPAALQHRDYIGNLPLHIECQNQCRSSIILQCIEQHPESLAIADYHGRLPLHILLENKSSSIDIILMMIEKYPAALQNWDNFSHLHLHLLVPLHMECENQCRSVIISKCIELYPEALSIADGQGFLPLHLLILSTSSSVVDALMMIEKYPAALRHQCQHGYLPLHIECYCRCRSAIISKCIELFPEGLEVATREIINLPLHLLLRNKLSMIDDALTMIEKYPAALQHRDNDGFLPLHYECKDQCRPSIILRCIELYSESVDDDIICSIFDKIHENNYHRGSGYRSVVAMVFTTRPMSLYQLRASRINDILTNPDYLRQILNLLPRHVFTPRHELDYRDLNWQPREAMMMLLSQMKIQQNTLSSYMYVSEYGGNSSFKSAKHHGR
jgi:ankyrin repeat protein